MRIISGKYGRRRFDVPTNITARPTTDFARENIFNVISNLTDIEGARVVDLFAGTGAVSFEFLSRGAREVVAVERSGVQAAFIRKVAEKLADPALKLVKGDVFKFLSGPHTQADIVFADPPYQLDRFEEVVPAVFASGLLGPGSIFILEHSRERSYEALPHFVERRAYGSVNFSIFILP